MKAFTAVLLVGAALCLEQVSSLHCYACEKAKSHEECEKTRCSDLNRFCVSLATKGPGEELSINKWCSDRCPSNYEIKSGETGIETNCCATDYCNSSSSSVKTSYTIMIMATLASFAYILQMGL